MAPVFYFPMVCLTRLLLVESLCLELFGTRHVSVMTLARRLFQTLSPRYVFLRLYFRRHHPVSSCQIILTSRSRRANPVPAMAGIARSVLIGVVMRQLLLP